MGALRPKCFALERSSSICLSIFLHLVSLSSLLPLFLYLSLTLSHKNNHSLMLALLGLWGCIWMGVCVFVCLGWLYDPAIDVCGVRGCPGVCCPPWGVWGVSGPC